MSIPDDQPPPSSPSKGVENAIHKLQNKLELADYMNHLVYLKTNQLSEVTEEMQEKLMLQGLDEDDLYHIHDFLEVSFDGELIKTPNEEISKKRLIQLSKLLNI